MSGLALLAAAAAAAAPAGDGADTAISLDTSQAALEGDWVVVAVAGLATWRPRGDASWQPIVVGEVLPAPSEIETGPTGQVTLVLGGDRLAVAPGSRLVLIARRPGEDQRLRQERGRLRVDIEPRPGRAVEVRTPLLSLGIKGTSFEVAVDPRQSSVLVLDGRVTVSTAGGGPPIELAPRQGLSQPTDLRQPARRLEVPDLPAAFDRAGPVRWHLAAPAGPADPAEAVETRAPGAVASAPNPLAAGTPAQAAEALAENRGSQGWLDDRRLPFTVVAVAAALLVLLIMPGLVLGQNLRQHWLERPGGKGKRRRSLIRGW
jgi:FecR protein